MQCLKSFPVTKPELEKRGTLTVKALRKMDSALKFLGSYPEAKRQMEQRKPLTEAELRRLDIKLRSMWNSMRNALSQGDIDHAVSYFSDSTKESYRKRFEAWSPEKRKRFARDLEDIQLIKEKGPWVEYDIRIVMKEKRFSFMLIFERDLDGKWTIRSF